jgi:signal transduction histidine kinase
MMGFPLSRKQDTGPLGSFSPGIIMHADLRAVYRESTNRRRIHRTMKKFKLLSPHGPLPFHARNGQNPSSSSMLSIGVPRWRRSDVGYLSGILLTSIGLWAGIAQTQFFQLAFPGLFLLCSVMVIALVWGIGPTVLTTILSLGVLDYVSIAPFAAFGIPTASDLFQLLTFVFAGIGVALLANRFEDAFRRLLKNEREQFAQACEAARQREQSLLDANERTVALLASICQELDYPITVIKGCLHLAERMVGQALQSEEELFRHLTALPTLLEQAQDQARWGDHLLKDLLDVSQIQMGTFSPQQILCDLVSITEQTVENLCRAASPRPLHLELPPEKPILVIADPDRLSQVITQYVTNALTYSPPDAAVSVHLTMEGPWVYVLVQDKGPGLAPAELARIWEPFSHLESVPVQSGAQRGFGVGLYLCRAIIEHYQGYLGVQSAPGRGSAFWFSLPVVAFHLNTRLTG